MNGTQTVLGRLDGEVAAQRLILDDAQRTAAQRLDALRESLERPASGILERLRRRLPRTAHLPATAPPGLYLWGGVGRGKTLLMDFFVDSMAGRAVRSHFYRFMRDVHAELSSIERSVRPLELVARRLAARTRVLCLDEFLVADIADAMLLAGLFDALFRRGVVLVATSNLPPQELYRDGLQRQRFLPAIELLQSRLDVIHLGGAVDYRLRQLVQAPTYLDSHAPTTPAALRARFLALAGGATRGPGTLEIEGRMLQAVDFAPGAVWFECRDLCNGPRSQNDYIDIARLHHTVFISNIPVFAAPDDDAARRFIMLIDEFYDRSVKIVVSAAAQPTGLYQGERLRFEFERAASRLMEMQTEFYLAASHRP